MSAVLDRYCAYLEGLNPESLGALADYVTDDVRFRDPFNEVTGVEAMTRVFTHMFETLGDIRFTVYSRVAEGNIGLLSWRFEAGLRGRPWSFEGTSRLVFAPDGRVREHVDYWDSARDFYEHLPVIGWLLAWLRRRIAIH